MNNMSDLSFTQTSRAMSSTHVPRVKHEYRPIWVIAATSNAKPKKVIDRRARGWKSQPNVFMGC
ncbi:MAG: hypothetical protein Unbinned6437contig1000_5 [Prokaryotic dsDNA virus sp.]|nr:MAG: hypothetical protein Unbinned6437contig1000_5 [Prokaryotic dsDNA virus sp.]